MMLLLISFILLAIGAAGLGKSAAVWATKRLPPGPPTIPFLGNVHQLPRRGIHFSYFDWAKKYGGLFSLKIGSLGDSIIVISNDKIGTTLLDKRAAITSDRPETYALGRLAFRNNHLLFMRSDQRLRLRRKLIAQMVTESRCDADHIPLIEAEATQFLRDICQYPEHMMEHAPRYSNSIVMALAFHSRTPRHDTRHMLDLEHLNNGFLELAEIGATPPVDWLPFLKYVPERLFGNWKSRSLRLRDDLLRLYAPLRQKAQARRDAVGATPSIYDAIRDQQDKLNMTDEEIDFLLGNVLEGGTDTVATTTLVFFQAMINFPAVCNAAQDQVDQAFGDTAIPRWHDLEKIPIVTQIVKECLRWRPPVPASVPHSMAKDEEYEGLHLKKGSTILLNIWGIHHDPKRYPNPSQFDPSRFAKHLKSASVYANANDGENRDHFAYGSGRRICPGIHLAERSLTTLFAKLLWGFSFAHKLDASGRPIPIDIRPETAYRDGFLNKVYPFEMVATPRSHRRREVMLEAADREERDILSKYHV
ncbi:cytochrome P450 2D18 [Xylariaceae sp. FL1019]|nr:cytochrome P450 2D18 [Xylariaceae sp. FL1019]